MCHYSVRPAGNLVGYPEGGIETRKLLCFPVFQENSRSTRIHFSRKRPFTHKIPRCAPPRVGGARRSSNALMGPSPVFFSRHSTTGYGTRSLTECQIR